MKLKKIFEDEIKKALKEEKTKLSYPDAGQNAPREVKKAIERFMSMSSEERETDILLYWLLGSGTPEYKMSKKDSGYVDRSKEPETVCTNCEYLYEKVGTGEYICSQIRGKVQPEGWCKYWKKVNQ